jgi:hypothetical protein
MKIKKNTFFTLVLELFFPSIANCKKLKILKIQKSTSPNAEPLEYEVQSHSGVIDTVVQVTTVSMIPLCPCAARLWCAAESDFHIKNSAKDHSQRFSTKLVAQWCHCHSCAANFVEYLHEFRAKFEKALTRVSEPRAHSFGHFEKCVLFNSRTCTSRLKSAGSEKREVEPRAVKSARYHALLTKLSKTRPT